MKKYTPYIIGIVILFLFFSLQKCENDKLAKAQGEYNILKDNLVKEKQKVAEFEVERVKEKDSLQKEIKKRESINKNLISKNDNLENKITEIKNKPVTIPKDLQEMVDYYNENYETAENKVVEDKIGLGYNTSFFVVEKLENEKKLTLMYDFKEAQLKNAYSAIDNLENDKKDLSVLNFSAEKQIKQQNELQLSSDKNINNLETQIKTQKRKNTWNSVLSVGAILGAGVLGHQIAK